MVFGQVVIGPPGSGKTTYCNGMSQFLQLLGRKVAVINLDPANDSLPYECTINIEDLIKLSDVMNEHSLGPNGGLVYCMDYLEKNVDWLESKLKPLLKDHYLLFDFLAK
ncbi:GPN-loop GTPase QQT1 [Camellia lanceoleosa]|uniref:GPN-loop GTPase QQT1 n=1 Tax=Camellia lanceoleosa TaxID=1840588 RepID=A0ACC0I2I5_9ERIC|nr:GPN-loop GTPase QQT1 [Camellia lanceoleosa]